MCLLSQGTKELENEMLFYTYLSNTPWMTSLFFLFSCKTVSWDSLPVCLSENHSTPNTGKSLSLYIIRQITSASLAYIPISHGLKIKSESQSPLLLLDPSLHHWEKDDVLQSCIQDCSHICAEILLRWRDQTSLYMSCINHKYPGNAVTAPVIANCVFSRTE